jgi:hypothetical protein
MSAGWGPEGALFREHPEDGVPKCIFEARAHRSNADDDREKTEGQGNAIHQIVLLQNNFTEANYFCTPRYFRGGYIIGVDFQLVRTSVHTGSHILPL